MERREVWFTGYLPILFLVLGTWAGVVLSELTGVPGGIGWFAGAVVGYYGSRTLLRAYFRRLLADVPDRQVGKARSGG